MSGPCALSQGGAVHRRLLRPRAAPPSPRPGEQRPGGVLAVRRAGGWVGGRRRFAKVIGMMRRGGGGVSGQCLVGIQCAGGTAWRCTGGSRRPHSLRRRAGAREGLLAPPRHAARLRSSCSLALSLSLSFPLFGSLPEELPLTILSDSLPPPVRRRSCFGPLAGTSGAGGVAPCGPGARLLSSRPQGAAARDLLALTWRTWVHRGGVGRAGQRARGPAPQPPAPRPPPPPQPAHTPKTGPVHARGCAVGGPGRLTGRSHWDAWRPSSGGDDRLRLSAAHGARRLASRTLLLRPVSVCASRAACGPAAHAVGSTRPSPFLCCRALDGTRRDCRGLLSGETGGGGR